MTRMTMKMTMMKNWVLGAAVLVVAGGVMGGVSRGDGLLDQGLGGNDPKAAAGEPAKPAAPAVKPDAATGADGQPADPKLTRPKMPDLVSPDAAKTVDDQDLLNKLTGKNNDDGGQAAGPGQKMQEVMDRMDQAAGRLTKEKDPGLVTQETQQRIVTDLDVMIEYLKKQDQKGGGGQGQGQPKPGQERTQSQGQQQGSAPGQGMGGTQGATDSNERSGSADTPGNNGTDIHEHSTGWGGLPPGDRALVAHGANEHYLPEYKDMIKKYYEALAEIGKASKGQ